MRHFVQFASDMFFLFSSVDLLHLPPLISGFTLYMKKSDFNPLFHAELSIYQHFDTEWGVHFRAPKDDLQLAAAVVFQPDF